MINNSLTRIKITITLTVMLASVFFLSCEKKTIHTVEYVVSEAKSDIEVIYMDTLGNVITQAVAFQSVQDVWRYSFTAEKGDIVYLSASYTDTLNAVKLQIFVDNKLFKSAISRNEPDKYITVSGTIAY